VETFTRSGALSISTVPRAAAALIVVFDPRGPRRAHIDYIRLNPKPSGCYRSAGFEVNPVSAADAAFRLDSTSPECFRGMPLTNMLVLQSVMIGSAMLSGSIVRTASRRQISDIHERRRYVANPNFFMWSIQTFVKLLCFSDLRPVPLCYDGAAGTRS
jgi:hypothetical protein